MKKPSPLHRFQEIQKMDIADKLIIGVLVLAWGFVIGDLICYFWNAVRQTGM